jgi:tRNA dimethylallyltransferase
MRTIGYKELIDYLKGQLDLNEAINLITRNTRRYAKRQLTWFRRYKDAVWIDPADFIDVDSVKKLALSIKEFYDN